jgi:glycerophosphoryl diester phosphodiesterase
MRQTPRILAHRGASGVAVENSLDAFRQAITLGADGVELDIHATRDHALVVHHDPSVDGFGDIREHSLDELRAQRLANGEPVPTLMEALDVLGDHEVWVEVKALPPAADEVLFHALRAGPAPERYGIHSFDHRLIHRLAARETGFRLGILLLSRLVDPAAALRAAGATTLWQEWPMIDAHLVETVHQAGAELIAWTVNGRTEAGRLAVLGVDALCGNYPDRLRIR